MRADDQVIDDLVTRIHAAALDPALWVGALERLGDLVGMAGAAVSVHGPGPTLPLARTARVNGPSEYDADTLAAILSDNPLGQFAERMPPGVAWSRRGVACDAEFERTQAYQLYFRPQRRYHSAHALLFRDGNTYGGLSLLRPQGMDDFASGDYRLLNRLIPHIGRAVQVSLHMQSLRFERDAERTALDCLERGAIVVDRAGRVVTLNRAAREIVAAADGLTVRAGALHAATAAETAQLARLIAGAAATGNGNGNSLDPGGAIALSRPSGKRPLSVLVAPLPSAAVNAPSRSAALLFVSDPERAEEASEQVLVRLYGLTPAEARLAAALVPGRGLACAAKSLDICLSTAHGTAKSLFAKTGVRRQAELVRLVLRGPAGLRFK
jgi:PAS domain-containing protein/DNA-binding CsgD family transcriptional regulator